MKKGLISGCWLTCLAVLCLLTSSPVASEEIASQQSAGDVVENKRELDYLTSISKTQYHLHRSDALNHSYHIFVHSSASEDSAVQEKFATVYLLDGGITFPLLAAYSKYLSLAEDLPNLLLVGISYGTDDFRKGNRRGTDFTAPAPNRAHYGGAGKFQAMIRDELFPFIEEKYPSDPNRRILFGQSSGGQFAIFNALTAPDLFHGLIASNPALHRNLDFFLKTHHKSKHATDKPLLYVSRAVEDDERFKQPAKKWVDHWQNQDSMPFVMKVDSLAGHNHFSAAPEAFRNGLMWILDN